MNSNKYIALLKAFLKGELILDLKPKDEQLGRIRQFNVPRVTNFIRTSTLELCAFEINSKQVAGEVAELGVYRGDFAKFINRAFPSRKLYLFDTFQGFDKKDIEFDVSNTFSTGTQDFSKTSIDEVLGKMEHRSQCVVRQGWFPETTEGLDEQFCFVSIDTDLYKPIFDGLEYFYPRLSKGGYIFVHDYNNAVYNGAKEAVRDFCNKYGVAFVPMADAWGSAIIAK